MAAARAIKVSLGIAIIICPIIGWLWILAGIIDFSRVRSYKRPIFCISPAKCASDDGSFGIYTGFCYSFELKGNLMPKDELPEVTEYTARIFHTPVMAGVRE